jgi:hypothetical protein
MYVPVSVHEDEVKGSYGVFEEILEDGRCYEHEYSWGNGAACLDTNHAETLLEHMDSEREIKEITC